MAQWQELLSLDSAFQGRVIQLYEGKFHREIRDCLSVWIESQNWALAAVDEQEAKNRFHELLAHLEEQRFRSVQEKNILKGPDFGRMKEYLQYCFEKNPVHLATILSECLNEEKRILASACEAQGCSSSAMDKQEDFDNRVKGLRHRTWQVEREIKSLENLYDKLEFLWQSQVEQWNILEQPQAVQEQTNFISQTKQIVLQEMVSIVNMADPIVNTLTVVELPEWKRRQQLACIGAPFDTCLDRLQMWFTTVAEALQHVRQQLKKLQELNKKYDSRDDSKLLSGIAALEEATITLFSKLLKNALVVEKQPCMPTLLQRPLILKTTVNFSMKVRFLANLPEFKCLLEVKPEFDKDVEEVKTITGFRHFRFTKDARKILDVDTPNGGLVAEFGHLSLKEHKGRTKGSNENILVVMEELHIIKFETKFQQAGLECSIEASSLPLVVISSTNQIPSAWAAVMWSNILTTSEPRDLSLFLDPPAVTWQQLSEVLSWQFLTVGERGLDENQLSMLKEKFVDDPDDLVYWKEFSKTKSTWVWIEGILDLIKKHLKDFWREGYIMGFVSRWTTDSLLQEKQSGNFLLRFSETIRDGAITFSYVEHSNGESHVHYVQPYTKKDLSLVSLSATIDTYNVKDENMNRNPLIYLYPDIPKDSVFGSYKTPLGTLAPWYVRRIYVPQSINSTPPPSPPSGDMMMMDSD